MKQSLLFLIIVLMLASSLGKLDQNIHIDLIEELSYQQPRDPVTRPPLNELVSLLYLEHGPIYIDGNVDFINQAAEEKWVGDGTMLNPYVIKELNVSGISDAYIEIRNTNVHFKISNCLLKGGRYGIFLYNVLNTQIDSNFIVECSFGIWLDSSENTIIIDNCISESTQWGVWYDSCANNILTNNIIGNNSEYGIHFENSCNNTVTNNTIFDNNRGISFSSCAINYIHGNQIYSNGDGIGVGESENNYINGNQVYNNSNGIQVYWSVNNKLVDNAITNNEETGVQITCTVITSFSNNTIFNNTVGISLDRSRINIISNNIISNNHYNGIQMHESRTNILANNTVFDNNQHGIFLERSDLNILARNSISNNTSGIFLNSANNNTIFNNAIFNNNEYGIILTRSGYNNVKWNNFIKNNLSESSQAQDEDDQGRKNTFAYNYWDDWTSPDAGGDGIVDNPYIIIGTSKNKDLFPRTLPIDLPSDTTAPLFTSTPTDIIIGPETSINLSWMAVDDNPVWFIIFSYVIAHDEALMQLPMRLRIYTFMQDMWDVAFTEYSSSGIWLSGAPIILYVGGLESGSHTYTCIVADAAGHVTKHNVSIHHVVEKITTTSSESYTYEPPYQEIPGWTSLILLFSIIVISLWRKLKDRL